MNYLGDTVIDLWSEEDPWMKVQGKDGKEVKISTLDLLATKWAGQEKIAVAAVNKHPELEQEISISLPGWDGNAAIYRLNANSADSYNDNGRTEIEIREENKGSFRDGMKIAISPHSVNIIQINKSLKGGK